MTQPTQDLNHGTPILASDLDPSKRTDAFMGAGFEELLAEAERKDVDVIVGRFYKRAYLDE